MKNKVLLILCWFYNSLDDGYFKTNLVFYKIKLQVGFKTIHLETHSFNAVLWSALDVVIKIN